MYLVTFKVLVIALKVLLFTLTEYLVTLKVLVFALKVLLFTLKATYFDLSYLPRHIRLMHDVMTTWCDFWT